MEAIQIRDVSKIFVAGSKVTKALDRVSFDVHKGEILGLLGANGAGKTTLISILCGLLSRDSGTAHVLGMDLDTELPAIRQRMNMVSGFSMVSMNMTVREYLRYFAMLYHAQADIDYLIATFGLKSKENAELTELSSGYKQRVQLAKAIVNSPEIILMDEPTVGLDVSIARKTRDTICQLRKKGTTILLTSHNLGEIELLCDRLVLIQKGKIVHIGTTEETKDRIRNNRMIELVCRDPHLLGKVRELAGVVTARQNNGSVIIEASSASAVPKVMKELVASCKDIQSIRKIEPTLEEAYLKITGK